MLLRGTRFENARICSEAGFEVGAAAPLLGVGGGPEAPRSAREPQKCSEEDGYITI